MHKIRKFLNAINVFLVLITIMSTVILFRNTDIDKFENLINLELNQNAMKVVIPLDVVKQDKKSVMMDLDKLAHKYNINLILSKLNEKPGSKEYIKYVFCANNNYYKVLPLVKGERLDNYSLDYFSTNKDTVQKDHISDFAGNHYFTVRTLDSYFKTHSMEGVYVVCFNSAQDLNKYKNIFIEDLSKATGSKITTLDIYSDLESNPPLSPIVIMLYLVTLLLLFYKILNSHKELAIYKMHGYTLREIWLTKIKPLLITQFELFIMCSYLTSFFLFKVYDKHFFMFLGKLLILDCILLIVSFILFSIPFLYLKRVSIVLMLKNKNKKNTIANVNNIVKVILTTCVLVFSLSILNNYKCLESFYNTSFDKWTSVKDYHVLPELYALPVEMVDSPKLMQLNYDLYMYYNSRGAILANFSSWSTMQSGSEEFDDSLRQHGVINTNYLKVNQILDENNKPIVVEDSFEDYVLLVPQKFKSKEDVIRTIYSDNLGNLSDSGVSYTGNKLLSKQHIHIIWTKDKQDYFTYDLTIGNDSKINDVIVRVITPKNGNRCDYDTILGINGQPFKIKSSEQDIRLQLNKMNIAQYVPSIISVYDSVKYEILNIRERMQIIGISLLICLLSVVITIMQNISNYFEQNKKLLAIQTLHGYSLLFKYGKYFKTLTITFMITSVFVLIISHKNWMQTVFTLFIVVVLEIILSFITIRRIEKRNIVEVIKGI